MNQGHGVLEHTYRILEDVRQERLRQDDKWGDNRHRPLDSWFRVLGEEVGEVAKALNDKESKAALRKELIQVAATAVEIVEDLDARHGEF